MAAADAMGPMLVTAADAAGPYPHSAERVPRSSRALASRRQATFLRQQLGQQAGHDMRSHMLLCRALVVLSLAWLNKRARQAWRRFRATEHRMSLGNKVRACAGHFIVISLLTNTFQLKRLSVARESAYSVVSAKRVSELLHADTVCMLPYPVTRQALIVMVPLALLLAWHVGALLVGHLREGQPLRFASARLRSCCSASRARYGPLDGLARVEAASSLPSPLPSDRSANGKQQCAPAAAAAGGAPLLSSKSQSSALLGAPHHACERLLEHPIPLLLPYNDSANSLVALYLGFLYLVSPFIAQNAFNVLTSRCIAGPDNEEAGDAEGGATWLEVYPSVECDSEVHRSLRAWSVVSVAIYAGLVPLLYLLLLVRNADAISVGGSTKNARALRTLTSGYDCRRAMARNWELLEFLKIQVLTSWACLVERGTSAQALFGLGCSFAFLLAFLLVRPLRHWHNHVFGAFCLLLQSFSLACVLLLKVQTWLPVEAEADPVLRQLRSGEDNLLLFFDVSLWLVFLMLGLSACLGYAFFTKPLGTLKWHSNDLEVANELPQPDKLHTHHVFLSHNWKSGQDQTHALKVHLREMIPRLKCWLDVEEEFTVESLPECVAAARVFLCFLSDGYMQSANCRRELEAAMAQQKPMVIVVESDPKRGAVALEHLLACAPESMRLNLEELFERGFDDPEQGPIPYHRGDGELRKTTLRLIGSQIMHALCPMRREDTVYLPGELGERTIRFDRPEKEAHVYISRANPGALEALQLATSATATASRKERYLSRLADAPSARTPTRLVRAAVFHKPLGSFHGGLGRPRQSTAWSKVRGFGLSCQSKFHSVVLSARVASRQDLNARGESSAKLGNLRSPRLGARTLRYFDVNGNEVRESNLDNCLIYTDDEREGWKMADHVFVYLNRRTFDPDNNPPTTHSGGAEGFVKELRNLLFLRPAEVPKNMVLAYEEDSCFGALSETFESSSLSYRTAAAAGSFPRGAVTGSRHVGSTSPPPPRASLAAVPASHANGVHASPPALRLRPSDAVDPSAEETAAPPALGSAAVSTLTELPSMQSISAHATFTNLPLTTSSEEPSAALSVSVPPASPGAHATPVAPAAATDTCSDAAAAEPSQHRPSLGGGSRRTSAISGRSRQASGRRRQLSRDPKLSDRPELESFIRELTRVLKEGGEMMDAAAAASSAAPASNFGKAGDGDGMPTSRGQQEQIRFELARLREGVKSKIDEARQVCARPRLRPHLLPPPGLSSPTTPHLSRVSLPSGLTSRPIARPTAARQSGQGGGRVPWRLLRRPSAHRARVLRRGARRDQALHLQDVWHPLLSGASPAPRPHGQDACWPAQQAAALGQRPSVAAAGAGHHRRRREHAEQRHDVGARGRERHGQLDAQPSRQQPGQPEAAARQAFHARAGGGAV